MLKVGIVGNGEDKFTYRGEIAACDLISDLIVDADVVISGHSPVGGIDIWAEDMARNQRIPVDIKIPKVHQWNPEGGYGYKARNLDIARDSTELHVIVADSYPRDYTGRQFDVCYHCARHNEPSDHVKSGGCWTGYKARDFGNKAVWHIIQN